MNMNNDLITERDGLKKGLYEAVSSSADELIPHKGTPIMSTHIAYNYWWCFG